MTKGIKCLPSTFFEICKTNVDFKYNLHMKVKKKKSCVLENQIPTRILIVHEESTSREF